MVTHGYPMMVSMVLYFVGKKCVGKFVFSNTCILLQTSDKLLVTGYSVSKECDKHLHYNISS